MSFELYVQGYAASGASGLPLERVLATLGASDVPDEFGFRSIVADEDSCEVLLKTDQGLVVAMTLVRPYDRIQLFDSLYSLLEDGPYVAFAPSIPGMFASPQPIECLPEGMAEALAPLTRVYSGEDIRRVIRAA